MGLAAASVPNLSTDAAETMAPALTEPVTQSDISGQSPRPGDSITPPHTTDTSVPDSATENQQNLLNNGKSKYHLSHTTNGQSPVATSPSSQNAINHQITIKNNNKLASVVEESLAAPDDQASSRGRRSNSAHMEQSECSKGAADQDAITSTAPQFQFNQSQQQSVQQPLDEPSDVDSLAIVNNNMGLPKDFGKEQAEVEQMLGDLTASGEIDLMSVIKTLESNPTEAGFDLAGGLSLFNDIEPDADTMNKVYEAVAQPASPTKENERVVEEMRTDIAKRQVQLQRKCDFLVRRLKKLQSTYMQQHASEEIAGVLEHCQRFLKDKERERNEKKSAAAAAAAEPPPSSILSELLPYQPPPGTSADESNDIKATVALRPVSSPAMKQLMKRVEATANYQRANLSKRQLSAQYFSTPLTDPPVIQTPGAPRPPAPNTYTTVPRFEDKVIEQIDSVSGLLHAELRIVEKALDSDATASSSGGESADEMILYSNPTQERLKIAKRAAWRWARDRSAVASRWTWLLAQISDLEYRIRQHSELYQQIKKTKGSVMLEGLDPTLASAEQSVNGYRGTLPGGSRPADQVVDDGSCDPDAGTSSRTRPFQRDKFRKRKLLQTSNLHTISKKAARSSTVKCGCHWPMHPCALCTGRADPTAPRDLPDTMPMCDRISLVDPCYHPVLSFKEDTTHAAHFEAIMQQPEWQAKAIKYSTKAAIKAAERAAHGDDVAPKLKKSKLKEDDRRAKKYRKNKKGTNNRLKLAQMFKNAKLHSNNAKKSNNKMRSASTSEGAANNKLQPAPGKAGGSGSFVNSYLQHLENESGGSGTNSSRSKNASPVPGSGHQKSERITSDHRRSRTSYDIDNIIIPYSVAAQARVEVLPYKEIPTPKWRVIDHDDDTETATAPSVPDTFDETNTSAAAFSQPSQQPQLTATPAPVTIKSEAVEDDDDLPLRIRRLSSTTMVQCEAHLTQTDIDTDLSDDLLLRMHEKALEEERRKFASYLKYPHTSRSRANRRIDSHASSGTNTPINPTSPGVVTPMDTEGAPSPAMYPSTPQTPLDGQEADSHLANALNQTVNALATGTRERRRTSSIKLLQHQSSIVDTRSNTPELREMIAPFEPRLFPLPDDVYEEMLAEMPILYQDITNSEVNHSLHLDESSSTSLLHHHDHSALRSSKSRRRLRRSTNNNSISYATDDVEEESDSDRNSIIQRLMQLEKEYDEERRNFDENSAAETESVDTEYVPEEEDPDDDDWYDPSVRY